MASNEDLHGRRIHYLRVSITDRCNLRCIYCMPEDGTSLMSHEDILSYEEITRLIRLAAEIGIRKVRITGGEPLVRRSVCDFVKAVAEIPGIEDVGLTTNGVLLKQMARSLWEAGLTRINVSLDTLNPMKFRKITRRDLYHRVLEGIAEAETIGFHPIRINVVAIKGTNDDELGCFARLSREKPYSIRFIEYMPMTNGRRWDDSQFLAASEIRNRLEGYGRLFPVPRSDFDGPSQRFRYDGARGELGLISAVSNHFCHTCNRMRLTSDGKLRPCLLSDNELDVRTSLREGCSDEEIVRLIREAIAMKPKSHSMNTQNKSARLAAMSRIGG